MQPFFAGFSGASTGGFDNLDGWGYRDDPEDNAIAAAETPFWSRAWQNYPRSLLSCSGLQVGLPDGQMGNSEVGHLNIGAGRVVYQDITRIDRAIHDGSFTQNKTLLEALEKAAAQPGAAVHIFGLLSPGGCP